MCWEIDYKFFAEQKKAKEARSKQRAGVIERLLNESHQQGDTSQVEEPQVRSKRLHLQNNRRAESRVRSTMPL